MEGTSSPGGESVEGSWVQLMAMFVAMPAITLSTRAQTGRRLATRSSSTPSGGDNSSEYVRLTWKVLWNKRYQKVENQRVMLLLLLTFSLKNVPPPHSFTSCVVLVGAILCYWLLVHNMEAIL